MWFYYGNLFTYIFFSFKGSEQSKKENLYFSSPRSSSNCTMLIRTNLRTHGGKCYQKIKNTKRMLHLFLFALEKMWPCTIPVMAICIFEPPTTFKAFFVLEKTFKTDHDGLASYKKHRPQNRRRFCFFFSGFPAVIPRKIRGFVLLISMGMSTF